MIERWNWDEREHRDQFAGQPFVALDPGGDGYALGFVPGQELPIGYCHALQPESLVELFLRTEAKVLLLEAQYITSLKKARSIQELGFRQAIAIGWVIHALQAAATWGWTLNMFQIAPSTWQAHQRRKHGKPGRLERGEGIELALENAEQVLGGQAEWEKATKARRTGLASALGIAEWWRAQF